MRPSACCPLLCRRAPCSAALPPMPRMRAWARKILDIQESHMCSGVGCARRLSALWAWLRWSPLGFQGPVRAWAA